MLGERQEFPRDKIIPSPAYYATAALSGDLRNTAAFSQCSDARLGSQSVNFIAPSARRTMTAPPSIADIGRQAAAARCSSCGGFFGTDRQADNIFPFSEFLRRRANPATSSGPLQLVSRSRARRCLPIEWHPALCHADIPRVGSTYIMLTQCMSMIRAPRIKRECRCAPVQAAARGRACAPRPPARSCRGRRAVFERRLASAQLVRRGAQRPWTAADAEGDLYFTCIFRRRVAEPTKDLSGNASWSIRKLQDSQTNPRGNRYVLTLCRTHLHRRKRNDRTNPTRKTQLDQRGCLSATRVSARVIFSGQFSLRSNDSQLILRGVGVSTRRRASES